jgi:protocatechuate 3,4-dioxygenase beta subunit
MRRRQFLSGVGGAIAASAAPFGRWATAAEKTGLAMPSDKCRPTIRQTEGPFLTPDSPRRSDIREDRPGVPLRLRLNVIDDLWCEPIKNAAVDIWHSDATGLYSAVENVQFDLKTLRLSGDSIDMRGTEFLRGHQVSGDDGRVEFTTIFPGWYTGRLPHIHIKTIVEGLAWTSHVSQLYFPTEIERAVYATPPYADRGPNPIGIDRDLVARGDAASVRLLTVPLEKVGEGFRGEFDLAVTF